MQPQLCELDPGSGEIYPDSGCMPELCAISATSPTLSYRDIDIHYVLKEYASANCTTVNMILAEIIKLAVDERTPLSQLLQFTIDIAGDQFVSEEFYQRHGDLLLWLDACGCDNEEIRFRAYVISHPDIFNCKEQGCNGRVEGGCPKMICNECGRLYYLIVDGLTDVMCRRCVAEKLGECKYDKDSEECPEEDRMRRRRIYAIDKRKEN